MKNIYEEHGYESRHEYLLALAEEHGIDVGDVYEVAALLGVGEDFDGLPSTLDDFSSIGEL